ncbi:Ig-like domain-containing protein [Photobacterium angustum]|uniref:Cadherin-like domain-containing protein n=1 Tax=Photobacterium angustum TaxID=661 RepID=A0A855SEM5_PHOAN|nr:Ig-like domain-containing protein [Photobacterium angustum]KJF82118.1 hypothetical protein UB36_08900 [Photobacterium damselae subsp. damselae]KJG41181.1 hypothetical protein UA35_10650 [Photobacterium angustum]KJG45957.1 hypothetical protein UA31_08905 [Photobacterium angustum]KJG48945.1 hypothetical protein UA30_11100 [Photobacterium angustum]KJG52964.1 hypothetical protein UA34_11120 [Photobacterium angustum]
MKKSCIPLVILLTACGGEDDGFLDQENSSNNGNDTSEFLPPITKDYEIIAFNQKAITVNLNNLFSDPDTKKENLIVSIEPNFKIKSPSKYELSNHNLTYIPNGFIGEQVIPYNVFDGRSSTTGYIKITNEPSSSSPITPDIIEVHTRDLIIYMGSSATQSFSLGSNGTVIDSLVGGSLGRISIHENQFTYTPNSNADGEDILSYVTTDSNGNVVSGTITINVITENDDNDDSEPLQPITKDYFVSMVAGTEKTISLNSGPSNISIDTIYGEKLGTISFAGSNFTYKSIAGKSGEDIIFYTMTDNDTGQTFKGKVVIDLSLPAPVTKDIILYVDAGESKTFSLGDGSSINKIEEITNEKLGSVSINGSEFTYNPSENQYGQDILSYIMVDPNNPNKKQTGNIIVNVVPPEKPILTYIGLDLGGANYEPGAELTSSLYCERRCDSYEYQWIINGKVVGTDESYILQPEDINHAVKLEVVGVDEYGQKSSSEYSIYSIATVNQIHSNHYSFIAAKSPSLDPYISSPDFIGWGAETLGAKDQYMPTPGAGYKLVATQMAYAYVPEYDPEDWGGAAVGAWGDIRHGGDMGIYDSNFGTHKLYYIKDCVASRFAFACVTGLDFYDYITENGDTPFGKVYTWYDHNHDASYAKVVEDEVPEGIDVIFAAENAFTALKGGDLVSWDVSANPTVLKLNDVVKVFDSGKQDSIWKRRPGFTAVTSTGRIYTWNGGETSAKELTFTSATGSPFSGDDIVSVHTTDWAYAAIMKDGSVQVWGQADKGGNISGIENQLSSGVVDIFSTSSAFAALKKDGTVVVWGDESSGGKNNTAVNLTDIKAISSTQLAFAAIKNDGSVVTWGDTSAGGDSSSVSSELVSGVKDIVGNREAFAAIKSDGSVVVWGYNHGGGLIASTDGVTEPTENANLVSRLNSGVINIQATLFAFAALKDNGEVVSWGRDYFGGDTSAVASEFVPDPNSFSLRETSIVEST